MEVVMHEPGSLYPAIPHNEAFFLEVSEIHSIYVATYGNKNGIPVIFLHGGPGAGTCPQDAQLFDSEKYYIILTDQRGAGQSTPQGELTENTTQHLVEDIERIRKHLNIDKWVVFGGSWGSTLGLVYAEAHPEFVLGLVLRGVYLSRYEDSIAFTSDNCLAAREKPEEWETFKKATRALIEEANLSIKSLDNIMDIYFHLQNHENKELADRAAATLATWEYTVSFMKVDSTILAWSSTPDGINMGRTEAYYLSHGCFLNDNHILDNIGKLQNIRTYIVQGIHDLVCPPYQAETLYEALRRVNSDPNMVTMRRTVAGHSRKEEETQRALIESLDDLAKKLRPEASFARSPFVTFPISRAESTNTESTVEYDADSREYTL
jgi:proline iminopeptidase